MLVITKQKAIKLALENAAALVEQMDLLSLYGEIGEGDGPEAKNLAHGQRVAVLLIRSLTKVAPKKKEL